MSNTADSKIVNLYIDGFNLYHAMDDLNDPELKWLDLMTLGQSFLRDGEIIGKVYYFTAIVPWSAEKAGRHHQYIKALKARGVTVVAGNFSKIQFHCSAMNRKCEKHEEKQTDVSIAITMVKDALQDAVDRIILLTADSDQIPAIKLISTVKPFIERTMYAPPMRLQKARNLGDQFTPKNRKEVSVGALKSCKLPREVVDAKGVLVAVRPLDYD